MINLPQHDFVDRDFAVGTPSQAGYNEAVCDFDIHQFNTNSVFITVNILSLLIFKLAFERYREQIEYYYK